MAHCMYVHLTLKHRSGTKGHMVGLRKRSLTFCYYLFDFRHKPKWLSSANSLAAWPPKGCKIHIQCVTLCHLLKSSDINALHCWCYETLCFIVWHQKTHFRSEKKNKRQQQDIWIWQGEMGWIITQVLHKSHLTNNSKYWCSTILYITIQY